MAKKEDNKKVLETIKTEAKEYYTWKNMIVRYIIIWFLLILLVIQFLIPHNKNSKQSVEELKNEALEELNNTEVSQWNNELEFDFLWEDLDLSKMDSDTKIKFDKILKKIQNDLDYKYTFL